MHIAVRIEDDTDDRIASIALDRFRYESHTHSSTAAARLRGSAPCAARRDGCSIQINNNKFSMLCSFLARKSSPPCTCPPNGSPAMHIVRLARQKCFKVLRINLASFLCKEKRPCCDHRPWLGAGVLIDFTPRTTAGSRQNQSNNLIHASLLKPQVGHGSRAARGGGCLSEQ